MKIRYKNNLRLFQYKTFIRFIAHFRRSKSNMKSYLTLIKMNEIMKSTLKHVHQEVFALMNSEASPVIYLNLLWPMKINKWTVTYLILKRDHYHICCDFRKESFMSDLKSTLKHFNSGFKEIAFKDYPHGDLDTDYSYFSHAGIVLLTILWSFYIGFKLEKTLSTGNYLSEDFSFGNFQHYTYI